MGVKQGGPRFSEFQNARYRRVAKVIHYGRQSGNLKKELGRSGFGHETALSPPSCHTWHNAWPNGCTETLLMQPSANRIKAAAHVLLEAGTTRRRIRAWFSMPGRLPTRGRNVEGPLSEVPCDDTAFFDDSSGNRFDCVTESTQSRRGSEWMKSTRKAL